MSKVLWIDFTLDPRNSLYFEIVGFFDDSWGWNVTHIIEFIIIFSETLIYNTKLTDYELKINITVFKIFQKIMTIYFNIIESN